MTFALTWPDQRSDFNLEAPCIHVEDNHLAGCAWREGLWFPKQFLIMIISSCMLCSLLLVITHTISTTNKLSQENRIYFNPHLRLDEGTVRDGLHDIIIFTIMSMIRFLTLTAPGHLAGFISMKIKIPKLSACLIFQLACSSILR